MSVRRRLAPGLLLLATACATVPGARPQARAALPASAPSTPAPRTPAPEPTKPPAPAPEKASPQSGPQAEQKAPLADLLSVAQRGELTAAESGFKTQVDRHPEDAAAWTNLGIAQERLGSNDEAERSYRRALALAPDQQAAWDNLTRLQCRTGRASQAETQLRELLRDEPEARAPRTALVLALLCQKKLTGAATEAMSVLRADERNVRAMQLLAQVYYRERKYELAQMVLENARAISPDEPATHNALGLVRLALGARPAALESFKKASELKRDFAEARNNFGALLNEAQDHAAATRELEAAVQAAPDFVSARLNLGNAYRGQGDFARALAEYQQVLRLAPGLPDTYFNLAILHLDAEPEDLDPIVRLQTALSFFDQYRARGGRDERVDDYVKDAQKGIDKEERRREREKREQLRKAQKAEAPASVPSPTPAPKKGATPARPTSGSGRVASDKK